MGGHEIRHAFVKVWNPSEHPGVDDHLVLALQSPLARGKGLLLWPTCYRHYQKYCQCIATGNKLRRLFSTPKSALEILKFFKTTGSKHRSWNTWSKNTRKKPGIDLVFEAWSLKFDARLDAWCIDSQLDACIWWYSKGLRGSSTGSIRCPNSSLPIQ